MSFAVGPSAYAVASSVAWGTVPDWLVAAGTLVAACGTVGALLIGFRQLGVQQVQIEEQQDEIVRMRRDQITTQAAGVSAVLQPMPSLLGAQAEVFNDGDRPVFDLVVTFVSAEGPTGSAEPIAVLRPRARAVANLSHPHFLASGVSVNFKDGQGREWTRDEHQELLSGIDIRNEIRTGLRDRA